MLVDEALERAETELLNTVSTSVWKPHSGEGLAFKSELASSGLGSGRRRWWMSRAADRGSKGLSDSFKFQTVTQQEGRGHASDGSTVHDDEGLL